MPRIKMVKTHVVSVSQRDTQPMTSFEYHTALQGVNG